MPESMLLSSLTRGFDEAVRDPVWGDIPFDQAFLALANSSAFVQLDGIRQLGPVSLVFPGATHTRRSHSIGVFHVARRQLMALLERGQADFTSRLGLRSFMVAALCHDLGHYPFAHSLKELPLARHETLAAELLATEPLRSLAGDCGADPDLAAAIIDGDRGKSEDSRETVFFRSLLSGVMDPDKIDYLTRDAFFCGVPYGVQDADFILRRILVGSGDRLGVDERGVMSVESVLFAKYLMYRSVYWHRRVRSATAMIRKAVILALDSGTMVPEELYGLDDRGFLSLMAGSSLPAAKLAVDALAGETFTLAAECPFDPENPMHTDLLELDRRLEAETTLASAAGVSGLDLVVDIPESISFETDMPVVGPEGERPFSETTTVFKPETIHGFSGTLRRVRVFCRGRTGPLFRLSEELLA
jgi:HD superfamily phosphohydrolase